MFTRPRVGVVEGRVQDLQDADALVLGLLRTCLHEKRPRNWHAVVGSGGGWGDPVTVVGGRSKEDLAHELREHAPDALLRAVFDAEGHAFFLLQASERVPDALPLDSRGAGVPLAGLVLRLGEEEEAEVRQRVRDEAREHVDRTWQVEWADGEETLDLTLAQARRSGREWRHPPECEGMYEDSVCREADLRLSLLLPHEQHAEEWTPWLHMSSPAAFLEVAGPLWAHRRGVPLVPVEVALEVWDLPWVRDERLTRLHRSVKWTEFVRKALQFEEAKGKGAVYGGQACLQVGTAGEPVRWEGGQARVEGELLRCVGDRADAVAAGQARRELWDR